MDQYKKIAHGIHGQSKRLIQKIYTYYSMIDDFLIFVLVISKSGEYSGINSFNESIILGVLYVLAEEIIVETSSNI